MLLISRKEVVDIFVTETVCETVQCWTVGQLRAVDFLSWFVFFGTILEKSLHFFPVLYIHSWCSHSSFNRKTRTGSLTRRLCTENILLLSHLVLGEFSGTDLRNFSVSFNWYNLFFLTLQHHNSLAGHLMSLLSSKHSPFRTAKWIICFVSAGFGACVGAGASLWAVLCIFKTYFEDMLTL